MGTMVYSLVWVVQDLYHQALPGRFNHHLISTSTDLQRRRAVEGLGGSQGRGFGGGLDPSFGV